MKKFGLITILLMALCSFSFVASAKNIPVGSSGRFDLIMVTETLRTEADGARAIDVKVCSWDGGKPGKTVFRFKRHPRTNKWMYRSGIDEEYSPMNYTNHILVNIFKYVSTH